MKWLDSFIFRCVNRARERDQAEPIMLDENPRRGRGISLTPSNKRVASNYDDDNVYNFTIYGANGGHIVEVLRYDEKKDRESARRYVITGDSDIGQEIGKIIMLEGLKHGR